MSRTLGPAARSFAIASLVFLALFGFGCGSGHGPRGENQLPTAQLTAGPVEGDTTSYEVRLFWTGNDPDGFVSAYEIAVDPPDELSTAEWERTTEFSRLFRFSTSEAESAGSVTSKLATGRFLGMHAVYVRAVDDEGAVSAPAHIAVTARSIAPVTTITGPNIQSTILRIGPALRVSWRGEDLDPAGAGPLRYEYKLIDLTELVPRVHLLSVVDPYMILLRAVGLPWVSVDDSLSVRLRLVVPSQYVFAVRAINAAGATEPFFDWGRNAFKFETLSGAGSPRLTVTSELGTYTWDGSMTHYVTYEMFLDAPIHFVVSATAEAYGEDIAGWRWGVDLADVESEEGWSPWTTDPDLSLPSFAHPGVHALYIEARDAVGGVTLATLILNVIEATMDRPVLWVDDARDTTFPIDAQQDAFWLSLFQDSGRFNMETEFFKFEVYGAGDVFSPTPMPPTLEQLGRYKTIVWECTGGGYDSQSGLLYVSTLNRQLGVYLLAGGQLWVDGTLTVPAMLPSQVSIHSDFNYPKNVAAEPSSFAYHFMKLASSRIMNAKGAVPNDNMIGVKPFPGSTAIYPQMDQDSNKINPFKASISHCDAIYDPIYLQDSGLAGVLDSLYVYQAKSAISSYQNKLNAVRWHDPDPAREHGRTQWFGFPLYYMKKDQAQETFNRAIDWFREEMRP